MRGSPAAEAAGGGEGVGFSGAPGAGPRGRGGGTPPESAPGETETELQTLTGRKHQGEMIGSFLEKGEAPAGESSVELAETVRSSQRLAEESLERERIPAELRKVAREYFEKLNERVQGD
ncbi:MAG: hypothetical protein ACO4CW_10700 [Planctomycetota bacterium]|jgi:hypothetical protein